MKNYNNLKNLAIIPARGGSKRIPKKNIKTFCGNPIISYSIKSSVNSNLFDEVMVSTDDEEIMKISIQCGAKVPFLRSKKNSDDHTGLSEVVEEVKKEYLKIGVKFDFVCCILPTAPFISPRSLLKGFNKLIESNLDVIFPIVRFSYPIQRSYRMIEGRLEMFYPEFYDSRSQDLEKSYHDAGQFYWMRYDKTLKSGNKSGFEISELESQDIDSENDWKLAEIKFNYIKNLNSN